MEYQESPHHARPWGKSVEQVKDGLADKAEDLRAKAAEIDTEAVRGHWESLLEYWAQADSFEQTLAVATFVPILWGIVRFGAKGVRTLFGSEDEDGRKDRAKREREEERARKERRASMELSSRDGRTHSSNASPLSKAQSRTEASRKSRRWVRDVVLGGDRRAEQRRRDLAPQTGVSDFLLRAGELTVDGPSYEFIERAKKKLAKHGPDVRILDVMEYRDSGVWKVRVAWTNIPEKEKQTTTNVTIVAAEPEMFAKSARQTKERSRRSKRALGTEKQSDFGSGVLSILGNPHETAKAIERDVLCMLRKKHGDNVQVTSMNHLPSADRGARAAYSIRWANVLDRLPSPDVEPGTICNISGKLYMPKAGQYISNGKSWAPLVNGEADWTATGAITGSSSTPRDGKLPMGVSDQASVEEARGEILKDLRRLFGPDARIFSMKKTHHSPVKSMDWYDVLWTTDPPEEKSLEDCRARFRSGGVFPNKDGQLGVEITGGTSTDRLPFGRLVQFTQNAGMNSGVAIIDVHGDALIDIRGRYDDSQAWREAAYAIKRERKGRGCTDGFTITSGSPITPGSPRWVFKFE